MSKAELHSKIQHWFSSESPLTKQIKDFSFRASQYQMASAYCDSIVAHKNLVVEAPTGVGKTLAYLIPILLLDTKSVIVTRTKVLQDQLFNNDLPNLLMHFPVGKKIALLKGKDNYVSKARLQSTRQLLKDLTAAEAADFFKIEQWANTTQTGDKADCPRVAQNASIWRYVTVKQSDEVDYSEFYAKARKKAMGADILVINQHLLCVDFKMREKTENGLFNQFNQFVVDEAHALPETAAMIFGEQVSHRQLLNLHEDCLKMIRNEIPDALDAEKQAVELKQLADQGQSTLKNNEGRFAWSQIVEQQPSISQWVKQVDHCLSALESQLTEHEERSDEIPALLIEIQSIRVNWQKLINMQALEDSLVIWCDIDVYGHFRIYLTPIAIGNRIKEMLQVSQSHWLFTSATLSVRGDFSLFEQRLGLEDNRNLKLETPFNYEQQAVLYMPSSLPNPNDALHTAKLLEQTSPIFKLLKGRSFLLFTSFRSLNMATDWLKQNTQFKLFIQGEEAPQRLLEAFRKSDNAILLATFSFWEGVDVKGAALSCVMIDKIPFAVPSDPLVKARERWYKKNKRNHFKEDYLPRAILQLRQGVGRLIRDANDKGVLILGDPRLQTHGYGNNILDSIPNFKRAKHLSEVESFWALHHEYLND